MQKIDIW